MKIVLTYKDEHGRPTPPLPKQAAISYKQRKYNLFWGARGPGKTDWLVYEGIANALEIRNNYVLFGRFDLDELRKTVLPRIEYLMPEGVVLSHNQQDREFKLFNGSIIGYTFLDESKRILPKLLSMNVGAICIDQLEEISENVFFGLKGTLRRPGTRQALYATANPVKNWVHRRWLQKVVDPGENPADYVEIGATSDENPYLDEAYLNILRSYPKAWRKRYYEASWEEPGGLVYPFNSSFVIPDSELNIPPEAERYEFVDYGVRVTVFLWVARLEDGRIAFYREFWSEDETADHNAEVVKAMRGEERIAGSFCCPSAFQVESDKRTAADRYAMHGIYLYNAYIHWRPRYEIVSRMFRDKQIVIAESCKHLIDELGRYSWPDVPIEDPKSEKPDKKNIHAVEAMERGLGYIEQGKMPDVQSFVEKEEKRAMWKMGYEREFPGVVWEEVTPKKKVLELY